MHGPGFVTIWFFIGMLLTAYGIVITATGLYELAVPLQNPPVLANLHTSIWWGFVLFVIGLTYLIRYFPGKN